MDNLEGMERCSAQLSSVQFSSFQSLSHVQLVVIPWMRHSRPPCTSPTPGIYSDSCPSCLRCHPAISSSVIPFSNPSQHQGLFQWVNSSHEVAKVLEFQLQRQSFQWKLISFKIGCWIPLQSKVLSRVFSNTIFRKHPFCAAQLSSQSNPHIHTWPLGKAIALNRRTFLDKVMSLLFDMLSRLVRTFLPRSKPLLISWLQSPSAVMLEPPKRRDDRKAQSSDWTRKKHKLQRSQLEALNHSCDEKFLKSQKPRSR